jgi:Dehydrogenases with different specificities (related to short-chain alcohol dehydrogenases)
MRSIENKVCVVTGSARSIGLGIACRYAELGAKVVMIDINPEVLDRAKEMQQEGKQVKGYIVNITDPKAVKDCFDDFQSVWGDVFALVNNAGVVSQNPIEEVTTQEWEKMMSVNVYGAFYCIQAVVPGMKEKKEGKIINFSSKSGKTGSALMVPYSSAKGAVIAMTQAIAFELAPYNINCNAICPGITDETGVWGEVSKGYIQNLKMEKDKVVDKFTAKVPLGRLTRIDDVVDYVEFLTRSGDYCTGQALNISGGREMH